MSDSTQSLSTAMEVEVKYAASQTTEVPELALIDGIAAVSSTAVHNLSARYFDTADLRLTRSKITLRRRTGGKDAGWHLKLPAEHGRMEIALPLGAESEQAPAEILNPIRAIVRDLPLQVIAQVDNERHESVLADDSGTPLAEFCDDHVTAWSLLPAGTKQMWREWELELTQEALEREDTSLNAQLLQSAHQVFQEAGAVASDSPSKLVAALGNSINYAPLPPAMAELDPDTAAHAVVNALRINRDRLLEVDPAVRRDDYDSVHQMRVATRELRSLMQTFEGILVGEEYLELEEELKLLAATLGVARDAEVVAERFQMLIGLDDDHIIDEAASTHLENDMQRKYERAHRTIVRVLNSKRYFALLAGLENLIAHPPLASAEQRSEVEEDVTKEQVKFEEESALFEHLDSAYKKLMKRHNVAVSEWEETETPLREREENFHNMRKAAKKLRYSADAVGRATGLKTKDLYAACKKMQSVLGDFQDSVTSRDELLALATSARKHVEDTFAYGVLYQRERELGAEALRGYAEAARDIESAYKKLAKSKKREAARTAAKAKKSAR
ncbi:CYTH and CHAD domain-containing protein [Corynebacterium sp. H127]|uniref:CYTH and CHAD domain-containing protein n=1 Tax=Corynebacterium sp. H127 TaxID=3133418 RepID=UPI0030A38BDB